METQIIYFAFDSHELRSDAKNTLNGLSVKLRNNSKVSLAIEGHCDERGTTEYNLALGEKRALAVKGYLINSGLDKSRLQTVSFGEEKPAAAGNDEQSWAKNRRAEIKIK
jgi:peptidoglycan-associated lipoprotein